MIRKVDRKLTERFDGSYKIKDIVLTNVTKLELLE